jgi:uncharacterized protein YbjT (DUF2867 family)
MPVSRILVLGATGGTGREVVAQAVKRGLAVTVFCREPGTFESGSGNLRVITGSVTSDAAALAAAMRGQDAVISTLGVGKSFKSGGLIATGAANIVRAMTGAGIRRLIFTSAFGVGETYRDAPLLPRLFIGTLLKDVYRDKAAGETAIRAADLDWTIVYPTGLTDRPAAGKCRSGERLALHGVPTISRADVATFLLGQLDDANFVRKGVLISS